MILKGWPVVPTYHTPIYSNTAFQILAYAIENITKTSFSKLVQDELLKPLKLSRTFSSPPLNDSNAAVNEGWRADLGDAAP